MIVPAAAGLVLLAVRPLHGSRPVVLRVTVVFLAAACLADWVLIEDLGFFGGLGTDPNSMIPLVLLVVAGYLALTPAPAAAPAEATWRERCHPAALRRAISAASARSVVSAAAVGVILLGAVPMVAAQALALTHPFR